MGKPTYPDQATFTKGLYSNTPRQLPDYTTEPDVNGARGALTRTPYSSGKSSPVDGTSGSEGKEKAPTFGYGR